MGNLFWMEINVPFDTIPITHLNTKEHHFMLKKYFLPSEFKTALPQCFQLWKTYQEEMVVGRRTEEREIFIQRNFKFSLKLQIYTISAPVPENYKREHSTWGKSLKKEGGKSVRMRQVRIYRCKHCNINSRRWEGETNAKSNTVSIKTSTLNEPIVRRSYRPLWFGWQRQLTTWWAIDTMTSHLPIRRCCKMHFPSRDTKWNDYIIHLY